MNWQMGEKLPIIGDLINTFYLSYDEEQNKYVKITYYSEQNTISST